MAGGGQQQRTIRKLQLACNTKFNEQLCYNVVQFWSDKAKRNINRYTIVKQIDDPATGKRGKEELFGTYSLIQVVYFMRDYWYLLNGIELPTDNEKWNKIREETILVSGNIQAKTES